MRLYRHLRGQNYYIESHPDKERFFRFLSKLDPKQILEAGRMLGIPPMSPKRMLFERIIPKLAAIFKLDDTLDYEDFFLAICEAFAQRVGLDPLQLYSAETFAAKIKAAAEQKEQQLQLPRRSLSLARSAPRLGRLVKDEVLDALLEILF